MVDGKRSGYLMTMMPFNLIGWMPRWPENYVSAVSVLTKLLIQVVRLIGLRPIG